MKKLITAVCLLLVLSLLCSCAGTGETKSNELKNRLIILALGLDKAEDGKILVSVQALNTDVTSNASSQSTPESMVKYYSQKGKSISEAVSKLSDLTGKNPLLSQNRIVIFGWELANDGISDYLDDFIRNTENRSSVLVAVSQEKAQKIVYADVGENIIPARMAEQIIESSAEQGYCLNTRVYDLINAITDEKSCLAVPVIRLKESDENSSKMYVDSIGIFKSDKLNSVKKTDVAKGVLFACNRIQNGTVEVEYNDSNVALSILKSTTRTKTEIADGKPKFTIKIDVSMSISEINGNILKKKTEKDFKMIEQLASKKIKEYVENSINECIIKESSDIFGFGKRLMRTQPKYYKNNITNWLEEMGASEYSVEVSVRLKGVGDSAAVLHG